MPWLKLIRWQNLLIILLTQFVAWWCIILPAEPEILTIVNFCLLALSTMLIAAAGYINDYFDVKIDAINKPERIVIETIIPRKQAIISHAVLNIIAMALAGYVARQAHHYEWLLLQASCILLLWFYSTDLKRKYLVGNIAISILTALTIFALFIYEPVMQSDAKLPLIADLKINKGESLPVWVLGVYAYFAFMLTWMREIVKDMEDLKGDAAEGCMTMPIKHGLEYSVRFTIVLSLLVIIPLLFASFILFKYNYQLLPLYLLFLLVLPLIVWAAFIGRSATEQHYHSASTGLKLIMILGICSLLIYDF